MSSERWLPAVDWPAYQVSDRGRVRRISGGQGAVVGRFLTVTNGLVQLMKEGRCWNVSVAGLILCAFVGHYPKGRPLARHLNDDRANNHLTNLAWGSYWENKQDAKRNGKTGPGLWKLTDDTRRHMSLSHKGLKNTPAKNKAISEGQRRAWARRKLERSITQ